MVLEDEEWREELGNNGSYAALMPSWVQQLGHWAPSQDDGSSSCYATVASVVAWALHPSEQEAIVTVVRGFMVQVLS